MGTVTLNQWNNLVIVMEISCPNVYFFIFTVVLPLDCVTPSSDPVSVDDFVPDGGRLDQSFLNDVSSIPSKEPTPVMEDDR